MNNDFDDFLRTVLNTDENLDSDLETKTLIKSKRKVNSHNIFLFILLVSGILVFFVNNFFYFLNHNLENIFLFYIVRISFFSLIIIPIYLNKELLVNLIERE